jgi:class 3 adenylate cyclase
MQAYQRAYGDVIARYEGLRACGEYLGDGPIVYFGWPKAHEDDAIRAGLEVTQAISELSVDSWRARGLSSAPRQPAQTLYP